MPNTPLITVIIPAYNAEKFIVEALQSVKRQGYSPIEIIVVDDGSTDRTAQLVAQTAPDATLITQVNAGASAARNAGMRHARGDFICFLDADDGWFAGKLHAQVAYLAQHPEVAAVYHAWLVWRPDADGNFTAPVQPRASSSQAIQSDKSGWLYCQLLLDSVVHTSTVMFRSEVLDEIGYFDTTLQTGEDYDYWLRVSRRYQIHKLAGTYSFYRAAPGSLTSSSTQKNNEYTVVANAIARWGRTGPDQSSLSPELINQRLYKLAFDFAYLRYQQGVFKIANDWFAQCLRHQVSAKGLLYYVATTVRGTLPRLRNRKV